MRRFLQSLQNGNQENPLICRRFWVVVDELFAPDAIDKFEPRGRGRLDDPEQTGRTLSAETDAPPPPERGGQGDFLQGFPAATIGKPLRGYLLSD